MLSDANILAEIHAGRLVFDPTPPEECFQPASVDVHLGNKLIFVNEDNRLLEMRPQGYLLMPMDFVLGELAESLTISNRLSCRIEGKSSNGRRGLGIHITAGFVDPGWSGVLTLEMFNFSQVPFLLKPGMKIAQLAFDYLQAPAMNPYGTKELGSKYQGAQGVEGSKA